MSTRRGLFRSGAVAASGLSLTDGASAKTSERGMRREKGRGRAVESTVTGAVDRNRSSGARETGPDASERRPGYEPKTTATRERRVRCGPTSAPANDPGEIYLLAPSRGDGQWLASPVRAGTRRRWGSVRRAGGSIPSSGRSTATCDPSTPEAPVTAATRGSRPPTANSRGADRTPADRTPLDSRTWLVAYNPSLSYPATHG